MAVLQRILKYGSGLDFILQFIGSICAVAAGVTLYVEFFLPCSAPNLSDS